MDGKTKRKILALYFAATFSEIFFLIPPAE
jgi:hypothetical protein